MKIAGIFGRRIKLVLYRGINEFLMRKTNYRSSTIYLYAYGIISQQTWRSKRESFQLLAIDYEGLSFNGSSYMRDRYQIDYDSRYSWGCPLIVDGIDLV